MNQAILLGRHCIAFDCRINTLLQAIKQNIQSKGLQAFYNHNAKFQYYVKLLYGLAFVPPDFVEEAFENVVQVYLETHTEDEGFQHFPEELEDLNSYFEQTYIGAIGGRQRTRHQPIYAVSTWQVSRHSG